MLPFITDTIRKHRRKEGKQTLRQQRRRRFQGNVMHPCSVRRVKSLRLWVAPEASVLRPAEMWAQKSRGDHHFFSFFLTLPREQTMVSWNNAADESVSKENKTLTSWVLKAHSWANTPACYNQGSVNFHCRLKLWKRENLFGFDTFYLLSSDC